ncbi:hypothetical protein J7J00_17275 [Bacillus sp. ISL-4]|uniref:hypothetical protein n=1 Tax=Bacillus sp. ISL-4 TaxID=2819125 RepID=UPI001BE76189|nr:hypothetical protein [Bacillus sp. ISL-4]MBT2667238.1 hypothetical protein [Bacillus sp. ISL-4]
MLGVGFTDYFRFLGGFFYCIGRVEATAKRRNVNKANDAPRIAFLMELTGALAENWSCL